MPTDNKLLALNKALSGFQGGKEVDDVDVDISVKSAGARTVTYTVKSTDRETTRNNVEGSLKRFRVGSVSRKMMTSKSSMEVTRCQMEDVMLTFVYKPTKGGMSQTTLNASITELFPCVAFTTGIKLRGVKNIEDFYNKVRTNNSNATCYLNKKDAKAGKEFIDKAETGKFVEKTKNALNILRWIEGVNRFHPIENVYWGYRAKPQGVMRNHPGDIFLKFDNGKLLGVSLKAGTEKTDEPKLNTYVRPIYEYYKKLNEYNKLKDLLWPQYEQIPGITPGDKRQWGNTVLALKTYEYEKMDEDGYNALYDKNLEIIKDELLKLLNSDFAKTKSWLLEKVAQQQQDVPLVVVKATERNARRDKSTDILVEAAQAATTINARINERKKSKQAWMVWLNDGTELELDFTTRTNKVGAAHKLGQFSNLAVKFNKVRKV